MRTYHNIDPIFNDKSKILILGSFPSVKSRQNQFFYHHPQNRFWKILENLFQVSLSTLDEKKEFLLSQHIALWDVIQSCEITGSSDVSIRNVIVNDIPSLLKTSDITKIFTNGKKAHELYKKHLFIATQIEDICLPSTSPANAGYSLEMLIDKYSIIKKFL